MEQAVISKWCFVTPHKLSVVLEVSQSVKGIPNFDKGMNISLQVVSRAIDYIERDFAILKTEVIHLIA